MMRGTMQQERLNDYTVFTSELSAVLQLHYAKVLAHLLCMRSTTLSRQGETWAAPLLAC